MPEQHDFINLYIANLVKEIEELTKTKILVATREAFEKANNEELKVKLAELEKSSAIEKDEVAKTWQLALEEKDAEVSNIQHEMAKLRRELGEKTAWSDKFQKELQAKEIELGVVKKDLENAVKDLTEKQNSKELPVKKVVKKRKTKEVNTLLNL